MLFAAVAAGGGANKGVSRCSGALGGTPGRPRSGSACCSPPGARRLRRRRERRGGRRRGAAAADSHGRPSAGREARRVDRVHRPLRGDRSGSRCAPRVHGLPRTRSISATAQIGREGRPAVRDRPAAVRGRARARPGRPRQRRGAGRARRHRVPAGRRPRPEPGLLAASYDQRRQEKEAAQASLMAAAGRDRERPARPRVHPHPRADRRPHLRPPGRHRQSGDRADAADHDRLARPDPLRSST